MGLDKPEITDVGDAAPADLEITDIVAGAGPQATPGREVTVHYVGVAHSTGGQFDASWDRGETFSFPLGAGRVIPGWDQGVAGMRVGGRRQLRIPPHLGYGDRGAGTVIKPGESLIFVVDLLEVG
jgi:peptidylprolyl isomerase